MQRSAVFSKLFFFLIISFSGACLCQAQAAENTRPESQCITKGVKFSVYPGAAQAAKKSGVHIDLDSGILHTPTGQVKWHDLTTNNVSQVGLVKNKFGKLVIIGVWPNKTVVLMLCDHGTIVKIDRVPGILPALD